MKTQDFFYDFPTSEISPALFTKVGEPNAAHNRGQLDFGEAIIVIRNLDFTDSSIFQRLAADPGVAIVLRIEKDDKNYIEVLRSPTKLYGKVTENLVTRLFTLTPYDYVRVKDLQGTLYFEGSKNRNQWFTLATTQITFDRSNVTVSYRVIGEAGWGLAPWGLGVWGE
jgi:hypothetical protein